MLRASNKQFSQTSVPRHQFALSYTPISAFGGFGALLPKSAATGRLIPTAILSTRGEKGGDIEERSSIGIIDQTAMLEKHVGILSESRSLLIVGHAISHAHQIC